MKSPLLTDKTYDVFKWFAQYLLPAAVALYCSLAVVWDFPAPDKVAATLAAVEVFLGALMGVSASQHESTVYAEGAKDALAEAAADGAFKDA